MKKLLIGLGNEFCGDDAIGITVARKLEERHADWDVITGALDGFNFIEAIEGYEKVLIVDALIAADPAAVPGTLYRVRLEDFKGLTDPSYLHSMNLAAAFAIGEKLGIKMPAQLTILGIGIRRKCDYGDSMDPELADRVPAIVSEIEESINKDLNP